MGLGREIKRNLLGCLEVALFMPEARLRFGTSYQEMLRSFYIPVILFPLSLLAVYLYPKPEIAAHSQIVISMLYSLRFALALGIFLGFVYFISARIQRTDHFFQFVTANNWLTLPSVIISIPILMMLTSGDAHSVQQAQALSAIVVIYTYAYTAFMAACVLRIPLELAGFIAIIGLIVNNSSHDILSWIGSVL